MTTDAVPTLEPVLLIDDLRVFRQRAAATIVRTSATGIDVLRQGATSGHRWEQMWLDHDLGDATGTSDEIGPVIDYLCRLAHEGRPVDVAQILVHTSNTVGGDVMMRTLARAGYPVQRVAAEQYMRVDERLLPS